MTSFQVREKCELIHFIPQPVAAVQLREAELFHSNWILLNSSPLSTAAIQERPKVNKANY